MFKIIIAFLLSFIPVPQQMQQALVNTPTAGSSGIPLVVVQAQNASDPSGTLATTLVVTITTSSTHLLVAVITEATAATNIATPTDSAGNTWVKVDSNATGGTGFRETAMYYTLEDMGSVTSVTANFNPTSAYKSAVVYEISGAALAAPVDVHLNNSAAANTTLTTAALTTTNAKDILICGVGFGGSQISGATAGSGYTIPTNGSTTLAAMEYRVVSATGVYTASMTWTSAAYQEWVFAAFKGL